MPYDEENGGLEDVVSADLQLIQYDPQVFQGTDGLNTHIIRDQFASVGVNADLSREVEVAVENLGSGVGAKCLGTLLSVPGLNKSRHDIIISQ